MDQENRLPDGTLLNNSYRIERQLGEGGFGITYLAFDIFLEKRVAIKEFFPQVFCKRDSATSQMLVGTSKNEVTVSRLKAKFLKETRNIARLNHPNIIKIFAAFEQNGTAYYVMELIDGCSLAEMVKLTGPLDESLAISYITRIGRALQYLHDNKITHLDVKPGNIMVCKADGEPILIDFGLSKQYDDNGQQTSSTPLGVSHGYAPMEQYHGGRMEEFSPESDIYSLAATFYYLVTGETPPHCDDIFNSGLSFPASFPARLIPVITKAMSPRKQDRQRSVDEFLAELTTTGQKQTNPSDGHERETTEINIDETDKKSSFNTSQGHISLPPTPRDIDEKTASQSFTPKRNKKKTALFISLSLIILAVISASAIYFINSDSNEQSSKASVPTEYSKELVELAESGNPEAQFNLGICYYKGRGVNQDFKEAVIWFRKAAVQGYAQAQHNLGFCYYNGEGVEKDLKEAVMWYRKAAEQGLKEAQFKVGLCYDNGQGVRQDFKEAVLWYRKAAEKGLAPAQYNLGLCYYNGQGVEPDFKEAVIWFRKAAEQGFAEAQHNLGVCYYFGNGVNKDDAKAKYWLKEAARQGINRAIDLLRVLGWD